MLRLHTHEKISVFERGFLSYRFLHDKIKTTVERHAEPLYESQDVAGKVHAEAAALTGLAEGTIVVGGASDNPAAAAEAPSGGRCWRICTAAL